MNGIRLAVEALGAKHGGAATVLCDLILAAAGDDRIETIYLLAPPRRLRRFSLPVSKKILDMGWPIPGDNRLLRLWWMEKQLPGVLRRLGCHSLISLSGCGSGGAAVPHVTLIQQCLPFSLEYLAASGLPERFRMKALRAAMKRSCLSSSKVIVQTQTMCQIVQAAFGLPRERLAVVAPSTAAFSEQLQAPGTALDPMRRSRAGVRVLYVGNDSPYKNVALLLRAADELRTRFPGLSVFLTWAVGHAATASPGVFPLGYLDQPDLRAAYSMADVLVMPSLQETVGLPLVEAMAAGLPVVAADLPYAREICGTAATFFDPRDSSSLALAIENVLTDDSLRSQLIREGLNRTEERRLDRNAEGMLDVIVGSLSRKTGPGSAPPA